MQAIHEELLETITNTVKTKYKDDIALFIIYGSCLNGTSHKKSDLDMLFIPKIKRGYQLAKSFILDGIGYDLWATEWETLHKFANYDDMRVSVLADSQLVYSATEEDRKTYETLKQQAFDIMNGSLKPELIWKAEGHLEKAKQYMGELVTKENIKYAGGILLELIDVICLLNHSFLRFGCKQISSELSQFEHLPNGFLNMFESLVNATEYEHILTLCKNIILETEAMHNSIKDKVLPVCNSDDYAGLYEEISSHWNKIRYSCDNEDVAGVYFAATFLQSELDYVKHGFQIKTDKWDLFNQYNPANLDAYKDAVNNIEKEFISLLNENNVPIVRYDSIADFEQSL